MLVDDAEILLPWMQERLGSNPVMSPARFIGYVNADGAVTASCSFNEYTGSCITVCLAVDVMSKDFMHTICDYPFNQLKVKQVLAYVAENNHASRRLIERVGFELVAIIPHVHADGGQCIYTMDREQCKWLEKDNETS